ncbi:hypothetical protein FIM02_03070 [SAR202 cluster bacterium AD-802-E10_MRT_200m]|nr:hypothetical protein [SAR202 cluster bacterium AD-802-E10_MRT_200m]MQF83128.1 hypothetical protein [SAR202 cluster bacterium AD-802-E10_MRT_200m]
MEDLELVLRTSGLGLATVFVSISLLTTLLLIWGKFKLQPKKGTAVDSSAQLDVHSDSPVTHIEPTENVTSQPETIDNSVKSDEGDSELIAIATAAIAAFDIWSTEANNVSLVSNPPDNQLLDRDIRIASWRLYGRQQLMQTQGALVRNWKRR